MAGSVIPSNGPVPLAPTAVYNVVMNAVSSGDIETVRQCIVQEPELINTFGKPERLQNFEQNKFVYINVYVHLFLLGNVGNIQGGGRKFQSGSLTVISQI